VQSRVRRDEAGVRMSVVFIWQEAGNLFPSVYVWKAFFNHDTTPLHNRWKAWAL